MNLRLAATELSICMAAALVPANAHAQQIDTYTGWNGTDFAQEFGASNTATYGQTFVATGSSLTDFSFWLANLDNGGALEFSAYVATWTGAEIGSLLWSSPSTFTGTGNAIFTQYLFNTGGTALTPGLTYVAFLNASAFIGANPGTSGHLIFGADIGNPYSAGAYVFDNNGDDFSELSSAWDQTGDNGFYGNGFDLAFVANFDDSASTVPEPASMTLLATGLAGIASAARRRKQQSKG